MVVGIEMVVAVGMAAGVFVGAGVEVLVAAGALVGVVVGDVAAVGCPPEPGTAGMYGVGEASAFTLGVGVL